jgi:UDP-glucose 4-epimerase
MKQTILLLGAYGFIGSNILEYINNNLIDYYNVIVFDMQSKHMDGLKFPCVKVSYEGSFNDSILLEKIFKNHRIDYVIHSISTTVPITSFNARYDIESNLIPTVELMNIMLKYDVKNIIYISSGGAVYGDEKKDHCETDVVYPISSYGVIKLSIEKYMMQYSKLYGLKPLILRLSNPYGKYHYSKKQGLCNVAVNCAVNHNEFIVYGDGTAKKDYIYVGDFVEILFKLISLKVSREIINIGSCQLYSVNEILQNICTYVPDFKWKYQDSSKYDVKNFNLNTDKLYGYIGDYNFMNLSDGIQMIIDWELKRFNNRI